MHNGGKMKKVFFFNLIWFLLLGCSESDFKIVPPEKVDLVQKSVAESLATDLLNSMKSGEFKELGEEATPAFQSGLSPEKQKMAYNQIKEIFGDFQSLSYYETCIPKEGNNMGTIYRFKGKFDSESTPEIRVVMNSKNKLSGFWVKPWSDEIK